jgi:hypothetical protein
MVTPAQGAAARSTWLAEEPLVAGLEAAPFQYTDQDLAKTYLTSRLSLTSLGKAVLAGGAD